MTSKTEERLARLEAVLNGVEPDELAEALKGVKAKKAKADRKNEERKRWHDRISVKANHAKVNVLTDIARRGNQAKRDKNVDAQREIEAEATEAVNLEPLDILFERKGVEVQDLKFTRWSPDTCGCVVLYAWDRKSDPETRKHIACGIEESCACHEKHAHDDDEHIGVLFSENRLKNEAVYAINPDRPTDVNWEFEKGSRKFRVTAPRGQPAAAVRQVAVKYPNELEVQEVD